ncbi:hypothetical protein CAXC1_110022 [Candidatus Xenohaliotis californiensis]|uniref:Uncharacterized protein n=1 Tax=Candidatus Xenohaliotis californiensis TaxID=84677 RepID=A0ABM9N7P8_9RICK|nr:hypothetical protein CAXC1_110022 [Candidatus Xenohaliotis californiensis]
MYEKYRINKLKVIIIDSYTTIMQLLNLLKIILCCFIKIYYIINFNKFEKLIIRKTVPSGRKYLLSINKKYYNL